MTALPDKIRFRSACDKVLGGQRELKGIGTLGEKTLHAVLKNYFEPYCDNQEIRIGGYVADIVGENGVIEIQTRSFDKLLRKLEAFLEYTKVTVVYPIPKIKYLQWLDLETGELKGRRKSPKKGTIYDCFKELYKIKYALDNPRFELCLCLLEIEEIRFLNGWSKDKKKGSSRCDRIPTKLLDEVYLRCPQDYGIFIPNDLNTEFTSADLAKICKTNRKNAQLALNILSYLEVVERVGKKGNSIIYRKNNLQKDRNERYDLFEIK